MGARHSLWVGTVMTSLFLYPAFAWARMYSLTVAGERLEFVPQPERGYVVKLVEKTGGIHALAGISAIDAEDTTPVGGSDRRGVWVVENDGRGGEKEEMIRSLRTSRQIAYATPLFSSNGETVAILPEIVVRVKPGVAMGEVQRLCESTGCTIRKRMEFTEQEYLLEVLGPDAESVFAAVEELGQVPEVEWACPNRAFQPRLCGQSVSAVRAPAGELCLASAGEDANAPGVFPNDEYFPMQWHLHNTGQSGGTPGADIRAPAAWEITTGDPNIVVAVVDAGADSKHPDLVNNLGAGYDFIDNDDQPDPVLDEPGNTHGTMCAGLVAAQGNNGIGVSGVTWDCKVMPVRGFCVQPVGTYVILTEADFATAFRWASDRGADVLSNSWDYSWSPTPIIQSAIVDITRIGGTGRGGKGCVVFFVAGNDSRQMPSYPPKYREVISVGATDHNDLRCYYSNYGSELDIVAPSGPGYTDDDWLVTKGMGWTWTTDISGPQGWNMDPFDPNVVDYTAMGGTSGACPVAAGVAALILSIEPNLTSDEVRHFLERSAKDLGDPGRDDYYGWGRVDARAALDMVLAYRCDLNKDWKVDEQDLAIVNAATDSNDLLADIAPAKKRDGVVDANDVVFLTQYLGAQIPELGLIAHWKLDESEGDIAHDGINHRDGTLHGGVTWQPTGGMVGGALQLGGVDAYASTPFILNPYSGPFSVFVWMKGGVAGQVILSQKNGANWLLADSGGRLATELKALVSQSGRTLASKVVITDGNWHRIGLLRDGTDRILYVDDVEVARDTQTSLVGGMNGFCFGVGKGLEAGTFWSGLIDDVRIYDHAVAP
ncbi:MAG TPA: S8 family serine peptidase [Sedimentisphaerales bacterium]|jgi:subtilisin family serine protease|nr:S8 family serine peptidase [Sedimentisphaerales bacterium]HNU27794.1 S8 family serine peptidase [Sedimentisphaerales bacterium]